MALGLATDGSERSDGDIGRLLAENGQRVRSSQSVKLDARMRLGAEIDAGQLKGGC